ncbi:MAG: hypothetical protein NVS2B3_07860 [Vulcanimicrobiaceae bacterium]
MQYRQIPVACVQPDAHDRAGFERAWPRILALVERAGSDGARLIVLPEGTVPGYVLGPEPLSNDAIARATDDLARFARTFGATIVCGVARADGGATYNAALAIGPDGTELGYAAKQFLWHFDRRWFAAGETLDPVETPFGRLGLLVCADGRIPSIAATLVERGARALVMPTAWVTSGRDPTLRENVQADLFANVRARENGVPFVVANKVGFERACVAYCGKSAIVDATGDFVARGSQDREEIVAGRIALALARPSEIASDASDARACESVAPGTVRANVATRVAVTMANDPSEIAALRALASTADAGAFFCSDEAFAAVGALASDAATRATTLDGVTVAIVRSRTVRDPRGLVPLRLAGVDCFVWPVDDPESGWDERVARTRATELRAFVVVFDRASDRAYAVDPDGTVVAGTFAGLRVAAFAYDPARAAATTVAPTSDVLAGLRTAEAIRSRSELARVR